LQGSFQHLLPGNSTILAVRLVRRKEVSSQESHRQTEGQAGILPPQWARELRRRPIRTLLCVQFNVPDEDPVLVGKYNGEKLEMTAAEAVGAILDHTDPMGLEVVIPRKITPKEISRTYLAPRITGWRYYPTAKGKPPFCHCRWCNQGEICAQRLIRE
jgi:hypothetical protein